MLKVKNKDTVLVSLLLTLKIFHTLFYVSIVNFEQVNASWDKLTGNVQPIIFTTYQRVNYKKLQLKIALSLKTCLYTALTQATAVKIVFTLLYSFLKKRYSDVICLSIPSENIIKTVFFYVFRGVDAGEISPAYHIWGIAKPPKFAIMNFGIK